METAKASEDIAATVAAVEQQPELQKQMRGSHRQQKKSSYSKDFLMSIVKKTFSALQVSLDFIAREWNREEIAAKVAAEVLRAGSYESKLPRSRRSGGTGFWGQLFRKCFHVAEDEWNTLEWLNDMGYPCFLQ